MVHIRGKINFARIRHIGILCITDKQFGAIELYREKYSPPHLQQLELLIKATKSV